MESQKLDTLQRIELSEGVEILLHPAGLPPRILAHLLDLLIRVGVYILLAIVFGLMGIFVGEGIVQGLGLLLLFFFEWLYHVIFEVGRKGATPGKRALGLRVVQTSGAPVTYLQSLLRNLLRFADALPGVFFVGFYLIGGGAISLSRSFRRLGDLVAGTMVVYDKPLSYWKPPPPVQGIQPMVPPVPLSREEQRALSDYLERAPDWSDARKIELANHLAPLTGTTGPAGVRRVLSMARWVQESA
ncbi:MAG: RDD family protein [Verrucomicrobiales bacterium]